MMSAVEPSSFNLVNLEVEKLDDKFFLNYTYNLFESDDKIIEVRINRVPVNTLQSMSTHELSFSVCQNDYNNRYDVVFGEVNASSIVIDQTIIKNMTINDIEKALGYKINIVDK